MSFPAVRSDISQRLTWFYVAIGLSVMMILGLLLKFGSLAVAGVAAALTVVLLTPLFIRQHLLFLSLWLFLVPLFDNMTGFKVAGANPVVFLLTGMTIPFALFLILKEFKNTAKALPFVLFLGLFCLVLFFNILRPESLTDAKNEFLKLFIEMFAILCGYQIFKNDPTRFLKSINWFMILNSGYALFQRLTGFGLHYIEGAARAGGLVGHPNVLGFLNVLYLPFALYCLLAEKDPKTRNFWLAGIILSTLALIITLCKSALFTLAIDILILFIFLPGKIKVRLLAVGISVVVLFFLADTLMHLQLQEQFLSRMSNNDSWEWRQKIWSWLIEGVNADSILLGHGTGSAQAYLISLIYGIPFYAHNVYLQLVYEFGLTSLFFFLALVVLVCKFLKDLLSASTIQNKLNLTFPLLILLSILLNMSCDNSVFLRTPMMFAWLFLSYFYLLESSTHGRNQIGSSRTGEKS